MAQISQSRAMELILSLPHANQIKDFDFRVETEVRFTWRSQRFRIGYHSLFVEEEDGSFLTVSNTAILMEELLKRRNSEIDRQK